MNSGSSFASGSQQTVAGVSSVQVVSPAGLANQTSRVAAVPDSTVLVADPQRPNERAILLNCNGKIDLDKFHATKNGQMSKSQLCTLWDGKNLLRADAAVALAKMNLAYRAHFGRNMVITSDYRTYAQQVDLYNQLGAGHAARPGCSNHGFGLAADIQVGKSFRSREYLWLKDNAGKYGFENPPELAQGGSFKDEPWHWEYFRAVEDARAHGMHCGAK